MTPTEQDKELMEGQAQQLLGDRYEDFKEYVDGIEDWDMSDVERYMNR